RLDRGIDVLGGAARQRAEPAAIAGINGRNGAAALRLAPCAIDQDLTVDHRAPNPARKTFVRPCVETTASGQEQLGAKAVASPQPEASCRLSEALLALGRKLHRGQKIGDTVARQRLVDGGEPGARLLEPAGKRQG